jgi:pyrroloquinoline quinone (PQQ) biosynthesis protein C
MSVADKIEQKLYTDNVVDRCDGGDAVSDALANFMDEYVEENGIRHQAVFMRLHEVLGWVRG